MENKRLVLVVDDEVANVFILEGVLSNEGYRVLTASDGFECLEMLRKHNDIELVLLDIMMPKMSGLEVLQRMMNHNFFKRIPVIMVSALTDGDNIEKALSMGAMEYIKKPIDEIELQARIETVLKLKDHENKLMESLKIKDDFIRMISHDLRTPFSTISGFAEILLMDKSFLKRLNDEQMEIMNFIKNSSMFVIEYFNKMLAWSNIGHRNLILEKEPVNLKEIITNITLTFKPKILEKNINYVKKLSDYIVEADPTYLEHAIGNLVSNAIKFTPENQDVSVYMLINDNENILCIKDSGNGIALDKKTIFNSEYLKSSPGTNGEKGTGTGLYICRKIIEAHGFKLDYEFPETGGTLFKIFFNKDHTSR